METTKLALDIAAGIVVPLVVAVMTALGPREGTEVIAVRRYLKRSVYPGLIAIFAAGVSVTAYGWVAGFYSAKPPDPLTALTADAQNWFQNFLTREDQPDAKLERFHFREDKRYIFVVGQDVYEIEKFWGYVVPTETARLAYEFPFSIQTASGSDKIVMKFFDESLHEMIEERPYTEVSQVPGAKGSHFFLRQIPLPAEFHIAKIGRILQTMSCPGTLDWIVIPLQRYTGGYDSFEYFVFFDRHLEKSGVYSLKGNAMELSLNNEVKPAALSVDQIDTTVQQVLTSVASLDQSAKSLLKIQDVQWHEAYRFSFPRNNVTPLTFQFIRKDE